MGIQIPQTQKAGDLIFRGLRKIAAGCDISGQSIFLKRQLSMDGQVFRQIFRKIKPQTQRMVRPVEKNKINVCQGPAFQV
jgi:hypothetical protein